jgi:eukaryotic-like serine/threonine-protein kinase
MNPAEHHQLLTDLLNEALQHEPQERAAFLAQACATNVQLRREVESLLASFEESSDFIETPALALFPEESDEVMEGRSIGHYRIVREIGRGGMGAVYLAERTDEYREQVALKIVKRGMDTDFMVRRFRHERQILASLHHPNIARLLDGGTTEDGRPYFVMEYIEGEPIDEYCAHHYLSISERLKLFRTVCAAVHYAHQNLVIHRDLKPGNILITVEGEVKLLDFGIAKIFNPEISQTIDRTATLMRLMTPEYASPEQVRGEQVTTASDVYSLGVVLYELLTGHRPYHLTSILPSDIERVICEQEPTRPSTAALQEEEKGKRKLAFPFFLSPLLPFSRSPLRGDLDNIVLMALRKEPLRRYASVEQFAEDIRRHLEGLPVIARSDTFSYRAGKFMQRHKAGVAAAALILLSLIAGLITTVWQARRAQAQQAKAERRFNDVRKLANSYLFEFHDAVEKLPGSTEARELVVKRALEYLDSLAREAGDDPSLQQELAAAYLKVGDVQGRPGFPNLGDTAGALSSYRKSLAIRAALPSFLQVRI